MKLINPLSGSMTPHRWLIRLRDAQERRALSVLSYTVSTLAAQLPLMQQLPPPHTVAETRKPAPKYGRAKFPY
jgi:hypothetical protein